MKALIKTETIDYDVMVGMRRGGGSRVTDVIQYPSNSSFVHQEILFKVWPTLL
jgi:hypothetical protein